MSSLRFKELGVWRWVGTWELGIGIQYATAFCSWVVVSLVDLYRTARKSISLFLPITFSFISLFLLKRQISDAKNLSKI